MRIYAPGNHPHDAPNRKDKGHYGGSCNVTACQLPNSAVWFNHGTRKYYCETCAYVLNNDKFNKADAARMYGHDLCTLREPES
jgi:hypothetical protein